jgi:hypothetical protein
VLNGGDLPGADANERQQLTQEAFFHLVGAIEVFAQLANERRNLRRLSEDVSISKLATTSWLQPSDPLKAQATALYANTRHPAPAADPYSGDGLMWRIWNYRHQVTHRRANPFLMKLRLANERRWPRRGFWAVNGTTAFGLPNTGAAAAELTLAAPPATAGAAAPLAPVTRTSAARTNTPRSVCRIGPLVLRSLSHGRSSVSTAAHPASGHRGISRESPQSQSRTQALAAARSSRRARCRPPGPACGNVTRQGS